MFKRIKEFFVGKPTPVATPATLVDTVPYKVPEPAATTPIPLIVTNSNPADNVPVVAEVAAPVVAEVAAPVVAEVAAKKPRKPRVPKVEKAPATAKASTKTAKKTVKSTKV